MRRRIARSLTLSTTLACCVVPSLGHAQVASNTAAYFSEIIHDATSVRANDSVATNVDDRVLQSGTYRAAISGSIANDANDDEIIVPEPGALSLFVMGLAGIGATRRQRPPLTRVRRALRKLSARRQSAIEFKTG